MRLIDADALRKKIRENLDDLDIGSIFGLLDLAPTVELKRPHGKWISRGNVGGVMNRGRACSLCGKVVEFSENYCPKCGAQMDLGGDNHD